MVTEVYFSQSHGSSLSLEDSKWGSTPEPHPNPSSFSAFASVGLTRVVPTVHGARKVHPLTGVSKISGGCLPGPKVSYGEIGCRKL